MTKEKYKAKSGREFYRPVLSEQSAWQIMEKSEGFCLACGAYGQAAEPDARQYTCESCGESRVYGMEELLSRGLVRIK